MSQGTLPKKLKLASGGKASSAVAVGRPMADPPTRPDPEWQAMLDRLAPPGTEDLAWFHLYWEPGSGHWDVVNRWMIGHVIPAKRIPPFVRDMLQGPNPRSMGYYDVVLQQFVSTAPPISERQWNYFQLTGRYLAPFWVIQGSRGGHKLRWSRYEQELAGINGRDTSLPLPGDLPYALPNNLTWKALEKERRMTEFEYLLGTMDQAHLLLDSEERRIAKNMRAELWEWMELQMEESASELEFAYRKDMDMAPDGDRDLPRKYEELKEEFITGQPVSWSSKTR